MNLFDAVSLIRHEALAAGPQTWCDLGCGSGTFTIALAELLAPGSVIYAVDKEKTEVETIPPHHRNMAIHKVIADFTTLEFRFPDVNGILMANSLHFVSHQMDFMKRLPVTIKQLLIVEYDHGTPSVCEPYPVGFTALQALLRDAGFLDIVKIGTRRSRYGGQIYSARAER